MQIAYPDEILFDEEPHTYTYRNKVYKSVTQYIRAAGLGPDFSMVSKERMEYAQARGRLVHLACQYYNEGDLNMDSVHPAIRGYVEAYISFRKMRSLTVIAAERRMIWEGSGLAGTPDLVCFMAGIRAVIDLKTSQSMSPSMRLQTVGYKYLWNRVYITQPIRERYGLRLQDNGKFKLVPHEDYEDEIAFVDALNEVKGTEDAGRAKRMERWKVKYGNSATATSGIIRSPWPTPYSGTDYANDPGC